METLTLYHGSIYDFESIDLSFGKPFKDFGIGFYTSASRMHAVSLAKRNKIIEEVRRNVGVRYAEAVQVWLYEYHFPLDALERLNVKEFNQADREWMQFVTMNRRSRRREHQYDMVIGPTANDKTNTIIQIYLSGGYGAVGSERAINTLLALIETDKLPGQYFFGSEKAIGYLTLHKKEQVA
ncbi:MAG: DUF3990 domain-containing protein [Spirochaetaceae bacterium]|jgi:hypothetical protein|nr:DUF3990 domain-containing protein [Spirochaetaceae bacterium]